MTETRHQTTVPDSPLTKKAFDELYHVFKTQSQFIKVHAAEYLIWLGQVNEVKKAFLHEDELYHDVPKYRVVIWRVLAQAEADPRLKKNWTDKIMAAFAAIDGPDRIHAAEALGKLKISPLTKHPNETNQILNKEKENLYVYTLWASSYSSKAALQANKSKFLNLLDTSPKEDLRRISAFVLRRENNLTLKEWKALAQKALAEPSTSAVKRAMLNTAFVTFPNASGLARLNEEIKAEMLKNYGQLSAGDSIELAQALTEKGNKTDLPVLAAMLENKNSAGIYDAASKEAADVRAAAAYAIIKIDGRNK